MLVHFGSSEEGLGNTKLERKRSVKSGGKHLNCSGMGWRAMSECKSYWKVEIPWK